MLQYYWKILKDQIHVVKKDRESIWNQDLYTETKYYLCARKVHLKEPCHAYF